MRRIRSRERNYGWRNCTFCKPEKVHAEWRQEGHSASEPIQLACDEHKDQIVDGPYKKTQPVKSEACAHPDDQSEADHALSRWYGI